MEDFGIITTIKDGCNTKLELSFEDSNSESSINKKNNRDSEEKKLSTVANRIINDISSKKSINGCIDFNGADISNVIVDGREVVVSNKMINRAHALFSELMTFPITVSNINLAIVYACNIVNCEYIKTWQDKQYLVLIILRKHVMDHVEYSMRDTIHIFIESYVPIIVEKILHKKRKMCKIPTFKCWNLTK